MSKVESIPEEKVTTKVHTELVDVVKDTNRKFSDKNELQPKAVPFNNMAREVSKGTFDCWKQTEDLWKILNAIPDDKIEKFEWNFILKSMGGDDIILNQDDSDFLFMYLDKDNSGDISKPELRALLNLVVRVNKWNQSNTPSRTEMIRATFQYALDDQKTNHAIDYKLRMAVISVKNSLTELLREMRTAKVDYGKVITAIDDEDKKVFKNPRKIFEDKLKKHTEIIQNYADGTLLKQYKGAEKLLAEAEQEYKSVNAQINKFLVQGRELERLTERDERCCKIFGCLCPC